MNEAQKIPLIDELRGILRCALAECNPDLEVHGRRCPLLEARLEDALKCVDRMEEVLDRMELIDLIEEFAGPG